MVSKWLAILVVAFITIVPFAGISATTSAVDRDTGSRASRDAKLVSWDAPVRLTTNTVNDSYPHLTVDSSGYSQIVYLQGNTTFNYQKVKNDGTSSIAERNILTANMSFHSVSNQPSEVAAVDTGGNIHIVWKDGSTGQTNYQEFDNTGAPQVAVTNPSSNSNGPFIDIGTNNAIYLGAWIIGGGHAGQLIKIDTAHNTQMVQVQSGAVSVSLVVDKWNGDDVHFFVKSLIENGLFHSRWSSNLVQENGSKRILPNLNYPPLPAATTTPNGNVHLLYASSATSPKTLSYVELDANGTLLNGPVNFTTDAGDYGDIAGDSNNDVHIVWGNATDGHAYYKLVIDGKENDSLAGPGTKLSTGLTGRSYYPQIDLATNNSPMVVLVNDGDGDEELCFIQGHMSYLKVNVKAAESAKFAYLHLNEVKSANWSLNYTSHIPDTIAVNVTIDYNGLEANGWNASLEFSEISVVSPHDYIPSLVHVHGPDKGFMNDTIRVCINAQSKTRPELKDSTCFNVTLNVTHSLDLMFEHFLQEVMSGSSVVFSAIVKNTGDITVDVNATITDSPVGWGVDVVPKAFDGISPGGTRYMNLTVRSPRSEPADSVGMVVLKVFERNATNVSDSAIAHALCTGYLNLSISANLREGHVLPGAVLNFTTSIKSDGSNSGPLYVNITFPEETGIWNVNATPNNIILTQTEKQDVTISIASPLDAVAGSKHNVTVVAVDVGKNVSATLNLTAIVDRIYGLNVAIIPSELEVEPGGTGEYTISIENTGNGISDLTLSAKEFPDNWSLYFPEGNVLTLLQGETKSIPVNVFVAKEALAGNYASKGTLFTNDHTFEYLFDLKTRVNEVYGINLTSPSTEGSAGVGETVIFRLNISNLCNCQDSVTISIPQDEIPSGWNYTLTLMDAQNGDVPLTNGMVDMVPGQMALIDLSISIPATGIIDNNFTILVKATSLGLIQKEISLFVIIKRSNLAFAPVPLPDNGAPKEEIKVGKKFVISIPIENNGDAACTRVNLSFYVDGEFISSEMVERILPGTEVDFEFTWMPKSSGTHTLKFVIDPNNEIIETDETDNEDTMTYEVTKEKKPGGSSIPGFESGLLFIATILVAMVITLARKQKMW